ncbi:MAG: hypothetical protein IV094_22040 [Vitreoscilla sp.]|nr:hypothetical protein [Vitreoscilla sp.]
MMEVPIPAMNADSDREANDPPTVADLIGDDPALLESLGRAALAAHLGAAGARVQRESIPEVCRCVRDIAMLAGRLMTRQSR